MHSLNLYLTSTYFQYNGKNYKQFSGTATGLPVSVVDATIVMQHVQERALATCRQKIPLWLSYVDDTLTTVRKEEIDAFHDHLNEKNTDIQFTKEMEENEKLPFLDCLITPNCKRQCTENRRKPTCYLTNHLTTQPHFDETRATSL